uniref:JmjC domain-containing protein n=1 Tax=Chromera velia CCMP2878 TaxID=1169474 RepID=A0A0G4HS97_9ALVE|eukprot:Cvel_1307.t1-p1 / transcript=Cvel_1307.t1 / gene=Cvel_1307 / organism=Chromera_velia_CCMP2878 / gene_product=F-box protein At5g06550, putative / transcript_product=F-box protein At5g06550, putative / location=Cvel_scaffold44:103228-107963(-) / protein_length=490 / sequence_SO=supercontig / SO=protein_coding / is_pseudo=false
MEIEEDEVKENRGAATSVQTNDTHSTNKPARRPYRSPTSTYLSLRGLYSDILFQRWLCANVELLPQWLRTNNLQRVKASELDVPTFISKFEEKNLPVVIEGAASSWPSVGKWGRDLFLSEHGDAQFLCGPVRMKFRDFATYMDRSKDDSPMFIFDPKFADSDVAPDLAGDFQPLEYFSDDLFTLLPQRPNYRWLLYGAKRSGSKWHIDPNMTSAWNAVVKGSKRWMMLPPGVTPPGVFPSPDGAEVTQPVSLVEWYLNFYEAAKDKSNTCGYTLLETTVHAGDVIFVPRGWWHAVLNVEDETIAITQNFVSPRALKHVRSFLHNRKEQISGVPESRRSTLGDEFDAALRRERPELMRGEEGDGGGGATSIEGDGGEGPSSGASCSFNRLSSLLAARKQSRGSGENPVVSNGCLETERQSCSAPGHLETPSTNPPTSHATDQETTGSLFGEDREVPDASQPPPPAAGSRDQTAGFSFWKRLQEKGGGGGWG